MFTVDVPSVPAQDAKAVLVSQDTSPKKAIPPPSTKTKPAAPSVEADIGFYCKDVTSIFKGSAFNSLAVLHGVLNRLGYSWKTISSGKVPQSVIAAIKTTVVEMPKHGKVEYTEPAGFFWHYTPDDDYTGPDRVKFVVEAKGRRFTFVVNILVHEVVDEFAKPPACEVFFNQPIKKTGMLDGQPTYAAAWSPLLRQAFSQIAYSFTNLPGTAVGQTTGTGNTASITLDTNAADHGWFIDSTPADNSEYLPTSDANVWIAKAGSAAEGKMDMLSVLLHEYGHALGFEHSANTADFMSASLVAGERRLPTADELTLMSQLIAKLKVGSGGGSGGIGGIGGSDGIDSNTPSSPSSPSSPSDPSAPLGGSLGLLALGRLRRNDYGGWRIALDSTQTIAPQASTQYQAQYEAAINATLTNGSFNGDSNNVNANVFSAK